MTTPRVFTQAPLGHSPENKHPPSKARGRAWLCSITLTNSLISREQGSPGGVARFSDIACLLVH